MDDLEKRIRVALGEEPADFAVAGASVFNVFTGAFEECDVLVAGGHIAAVLPAGTCEETGEAGKNILNAKGAYLVPGFIDAHAHVESSMVAPEEFAALAASCGVTTVVADPHEIANIFGADGIRYMLRATENAAARVLFMLPSCVPASPLEEAAHTLGAAELAPFLGHPRILGLGEMMNYPGVAARQPDVMEKIAMIRQYNEAAFGSLRGLSLDGHAPYLDGRRLQAYAAAGIHSDHEASTVDEAAERLANGMGLMLREGSAAKNLLALVPAVTPYTIDSCMLCTDDRQPMDLLREGSINHLVKMLQADGRIPLPGILRMAGWNAARHFSLRETGAIAPGFRADFALYPDLTSWKPLYVWSEGRLTVEAGVPARPGLLIREDAGKKADCALRGSVRLANSLGPEALRVPDTGGPVKVIGLVPGQIITEKLEARLPAEDGFLVADAANDIAKLAVFERHRGTSRIGLGFAKGMGLRGGAIASTVAHDSHNLIVLGMDDNSMLMAVRALRDAGGGLAAVRQDGETRVLSLPLGGIFSDASIAEVEKGLRELAAFTQRLGVSEGREPFMALAFLSLAVIPRLKLTDGGLVDVDAFTVTSLYV